MKDQAGEARVIKDCWVEDRPGKRKEHEIVTGVKNDMGDQKFGKHFVDIRGHRETYTSGGFDRVCQILKNRKFKPKVFEPGLLVPASSTQKPTYTDQSEGSIADQDHYLQSTEETEVPRNPPHPRFRYQVVYDEKGESLFEVTSLSKVLAYIGQAAEGS